MEASNRIIEETVSVLETAGEITQRWELIAAPQELFMQIFPMETHKKHLMLVRHALNVRVEQARVKEQKASARKKRKGRGDESSSDVDELEEGGFDFHKSMKKYGLANMPTTHTQKTKSIEDISKKAKKAFNKHKKYLAPGDVMDFAPQWMENKRPRNTRAGDMTHGHWVAAWWSRALAQVAAQGAAESETVSFENLLVQFLNANMLAIKHGTKTGWELDKHIWDTVVEKTGRRDPNIDVVRELTVINENDLTRVQKKIQDGFGPQWGKQGVGGGKTELLVQ